jgi:protein O-mannosyl-transferase
MDRKNKGSRPSGKANPTAGRGLARPNRAEVPADEAVQPRPRLAPLVSFVVLLAVAALLYTLAGVLQGEFSVADDSAYIVENGHFDRPLNLVGLAQIFNSIAKEEMLHDYYRPIYVLVRTIDYHLYGTSPFGYHVTSLLFYLLAVGSAYWILLKLLPSTRAALVGALLFALHPIHVEAVAWVMAGGYTIAGALALLCFALYLSRQTWASGLAFAAAALANPPAAVMPALVVGHMWLFPAKEAGERRRRWENLGLMAAAAAGVVYLNFVVFPQRYARAFFDSAVAVRSWLANFFATLRLLVVPLGLRTPYEGYIEKLGDPRWMAGAASLLLMGAGVLALRRRSRAAAFGLFWVLVGVLPTVTVWKNATGMADRYVFIASFGLILAAVALLSARSDVGLLADRFQAWVGKARTLLGVAFLLFFAAVTWQRVRAWHDTETLFADTLAKDPANIFAARTLARYYSVTASTPEKAVPHLEKSIQLAEERIAKLANPSLVHFEQYNLAEIRNELGIVNRESGQYEKAVALHESAIAGIPNTGPEGYRTAEYYFQMGLAYDKWADLRKKTGDQPGFAAALEDALSCYRQSIERLPISSKSYQNAGLALLRLGRLPEAESTLDRALTLTPNNLEVIGLLANVHMQAGNREKAGALLDEAVQKAARRQGNGPLMRELQRSKSKLAAQPETPTSPSFDGDALFVTLLRQQKYEEALRVALSLKKGQDSPDPSLLNNIGLCYYKLARYPEAESAYLEAVKLRPDYDTAMDNLSLVYAKQNRFDLAISFAERALQLKPGDPGITRHLAAYRRQSGAGEQDGAR